MELAAEGWIAITVLGAAALIGVGLFVAMLFRRVVNTNEVHIVQSARATMCVVNVLLAVAS